VLLRLTVYAAIAAAALHAVVVAAEHGYAASFNEEYGPIELGHCTMALAAFALFGIAARSTTSYADVLRLASTALLFFFFRELDEVLDLLVGDHAYKVLNAPVVLWAAWLLWNGREHLIEEVARYLTTPSAYLALFGLFLVAIHGQIIGQKELWLALGPDRKAMLTAKGVAEEVTEISGYLFLMFSGVEAWLAGRPRRLP
jgi:hypothetical protein